jgi:hypothetical protein
VAAIENNQVSIALAFVCVRLIAGDVHFGSKVDMGLPLIDARVTPPKADIRQRNCDVRFVPKADKCTAAYLAACRWLILTQPVERLEY